VSIMSLPGPPGKTPLLAAGTNGSSSYCSAEWIRWFNQLSDATSAGTGTDTGGGGSGGGGATDAIIDWNATSGPAQILNQPSISTDNQAWASFSVRPTFNDPSYLTFDFSGTQPQITSSSGVIHTIAGLLITAAPTHYGVNIQGTASPIQAYSPDSSRFFQLGLANAYDPTLYSSTGRLAVNSGLVVTAAPINYGINIQGTASPIQAYSPDKSRFFQLGIANTTDPEFYSSTGNISVIGSLSIPNLPSAASLATDASGKIIAGTAGGIIDTGLNWYSPDHTRYGQLLCANGGDPTINSSTGTLAVTAGLVVTAPSANVGISLHGSTVPIQAYSPDASRRLELGIANTSDPAFYSSTALITLAATALRFDAPLANGALQFGSQSQKYATIFAGIGTNYQLLYNSSGTYYNGTNWIASATSCCFTQLGNPSPGNLFVLASATGQTIGNVVTLVNVFSVDWSGNATITGSVTANGGLVSNTGFTWYSPDKTRYGQLLCANGGNPTINSSTGLLAVTAGLVVTAAPANYGINIQGTASPIQAYSPDASRWFQLGIANTSDPTLYSSTGVVAINDGLLVTSGPGHYGINIQGTASPIIAYSPDASRYFTMGIANTTNPVLYSSTGVLESNVQCDNVGTTYGWVCRSADRTRWGSWGCVNAGHPTLCSSTGYVIVGPPGTTNFQVQAAVQVISASGLLVYSPDTSRNLQIYMSNTGHPIVTPSTGSISFNSAATQMICLFAPANVVNGSFNMGNNGTANFAAGAYLNTSQQWIATQTSAGIMAFGAAYSGGFSFFVNSGLTIGGGVSPSPIFAITASGVTVTGTASCTAVTCTGSISAAVNVTASGAVIASNFQVSATATGSGYLQIMNNGQTGRTNPWIYSSTGTIEIYPGVGIQMFSNLMIQNNSPLNIWDSTHACQFIIGITASGASFYSSVGDLAHNGVFNANGYRCRPGNAGTPVTNIHNINWTGAAQLWIDTTNVGTISLTSDYRVKENVESLDSALALVMKLRPVCFDYRNIEDDLFRSDHVRHLGFLAHEVQELVPGAVNGEKDALTVDGKIQPQSMNTMDLIALLTRAVQELSTKVEHYGIAHA
jgi:hypothetical protein